MSEHPCWVGIDVAADTLDLTLVPGDTHWPEPNTAAGHHRIVQRLQPLAPARIVLDASGATSGGS